MKGELINLLNTLDYIAFYKFFIFLSNSGKASLYFIDYPLQPLSTLFNFVLCLLLLTPKFL